jgi:hypothetical protein
MSEEHSYNTQYFFRQILAPLLPAVFPDGRKPHFRRLCLHLDNCHVGPSKDSQHFSLKILLFEYRTRLTVLTWHLLTSGFPVI